MEEGQYLQEISVVDVDTSVADYGYLQYILALARSLNCNIHQTELVNESFGEQLAADTSDLDKDCGVRFVHREGLVQLSPHSLNIVLNLYSGEKRCNELDEVLVNHSDAQVRWLGSD